MALSSVRLRRAEHSLHLQGDGHGWQKLNEPGIKEIPQWVKDGRTSPTGRHTFTTWKHWTKTDKLLPSGLLGPVSMKYDAAFSAAAQRREDRTHKVNATSNKK